MKTHIKRGKDAGARASGAIGKAVLHGKVEELLHEIWNINFIFRDELFKCDALTRCR